MKFFSKKVFIIMAILASIFILFYWIGVAEYFTLQNLQKNHLFLKAYVHDHYLLSVSIYIALFSGLLACGLPIVIPMALIGGFLYGLYWGIFYASASCLIGSVTSYIVLRYVAASWIKGWHNERIEKFNQQIQKYGYSYLLILHFLSVVPLLVINLLAAIANVPLITIIWVTLVGTLPFNFLCALAGQRLSEIHSFKDIFSPTIIILLLLLASTAIVPMIIKKWRGSLSV